jgi:uncharacterized membrane protein
MSAENKQYQRPLGYTAALWTHFVIILALPYFIFFLPYVAWGLLISPLARYSNYLLAAVPVAALTSYIVYAVQRGKPEEDREREWSRFQTLQATMYQFVLLVVVLALPSEAWDVYSFPLGYVFDVVLALAVAMILYGLIGAFAILRGNDEFTYPGIGWFARRIVQGRYVRREQDKKRQADKAQKAKK